MSFNLVNDFEDLKVWSVTSHSNPDINYVVSVDDEGYVFCSCPHFSHRLSRDSLVMIDETDRHCKHLKEILQEA